MFGCPKHFWIHILIWIYWQRENKVHFSPIRSDALICLTSSSITFHLRSDWKKRSKVELHLLTSWQMIGVFLCFALHFTCNKNQYYLYYRKLQMMIQVVAALTQRMKKIKGWVHSKLQWKTLHLNNIDFYSDVCVCVYSHGRACVCMGVWVCAWVHVCVSVLS